MDYSIVVGLISISTASLLIGRWFGKRQQSKQQRGSTPAADLVNAPAAQLGKNISEIYAQAYEEAGRLITETHQSTEKRLHAEVEELNSTFSRLTSETKQTLESTNNEMHTLFQTAFMQTQADLTESGKIWQSELTTTTESLRTLVAKTAKSIEESQVAAKDFLQAVRADGEALQAENAEIRRSLSEQRLAILTAAESDAARIRADAEQQSAHFLEMSQNTFNQQLSEIKRASELQISSATEKLMEQLGQETSMTINQIKKIVSQTQHQSWEKIEGFNHQILEKFEQITDHVINQGEARAKSIGEKVLVQIEDEIVLFVIGIIKETLNLKLTPEEHQEIIMQAVTKLKTEHDRKAAAAEDLPLTPQGKPAKQSRAKAAKNAPVIEKQEVELNSRFSKIESPFFKIPDEADAHVPFSSAPAVETAVTKQEAKK